MEDLKQQYLDELKRLSNLEYCDEWAYLSTHPSKRLLSFCFDDDDEDYTSAITPDEPVLSTEEPDHSLRGIDDDILLMIKDDILREKLRNVNLLISKIEALNANPTPSSDCKTKSSSTSLNSLLEETNTFDN
nr:hypothetical protein [Tanacetum cinerariifolium]GFC65559.1 hypothetical protein [Tanacetum cinerariifolium]